MENTPEATNPDRMVSMDDEVEEGELREDSMPNVDGASSERRFTGSEQALPCIQSGEPSSGAGSRGNNVNIEFPVTLPKWDARTKQIPKRYGLTVITSTLGKELKEFKRWCTKEVNLHRDGPALSRTTYDKNYLPQIKLYLGFVEAVEVRPCCGLEEYLRLDLYAMFLGFLRAAERHAQLLGDHTRTA